MDEKKCSLCKEQAFYKLEGIFYCKRHLTYELKEEIDHIKPKLKKIIKLKSKKENHPKIKEINDRRLREDLNVGLKETILSNEILEENLRRVENGEPLTMPLSRLGPLFKLKYNQIFNTDVPLISSSKYSWENIKRHKNYQRTCLFCREIFKTRYPNKLFCSKQCKERYLKLPEVKESFRVKKEGYYNSPRMKKWAEKYRKEYYKRPEVRERLKKYQQEMKYFFKIPETIFKKIEKICNQSEYFLLKNKKD